MNNMMLMIMKLTAKMELVEKFSKYQLPSEQILTPTMDTARPSTSLPYAQKSQHFGTVNCRQSQLNNDSAQNGGQTLGGAPAELPRFGYSQHERSGYTTDSAQNVGQTLGVAPAELHRGADGQRIGAE